MVYRLKKTDVGGPLSTWLKSYLHDRKQIVRFGNTTSSLVIEAFCGVPQESHLGPVLFWCMYLSLEWHSKCFQKVTLLVFCRQSKTVSNCQLFKWQNPVTKQPGRRKFDGLYCYNTDERFLKQVDRIKDLEVILDLRVIYSLNIDDVARLAKCSVWFDHL